MLLQFWIWICFFNIKSKIVRKVFDNNNDDIMLGLFCQDSSDVIVGTFSGSMTKQYMIGHMSVSLSCLVVILDLTHN